MAYLVPLNTSGASRIELGNETLIGSSPENSIVINDSSVSSRHARITREGNKFKLVDLDSTNGTKVGGKLVHEAFLHNADAVTFGSVVWQFVHEQENVMPILSKRMRVGILGFGLFGALLWIIWIQQQNTISDASSTDHARPSSPKPVSAISREAAPDITFSDENKRIVQITIQRVLVGSSAVNSNLISNLEVEITNKQKRIPVYFTVSVKNLDSDPLDIAHYQFTAEDESGESYAAGWTTDRLSGEAQPGKSVRGGIYFGITPGRSISKLLYKTRWTRRLDNKTIYVEGDLMPVSILKNLQ